MKATKYCPGCIERPLIPPRVALSRYGHGDLCPACGTIEALEGNFIQQRKDFASVL